MISERHGKAVLRLRSVIDEAIANWPDDAQRWILEQRAKRGDVQLTLVIDNSGDPKIEMEAAGCVLGHVELAALDRRRTMEHQLRVVAETVSQKAARYLAEGRLAVWHMDRNGARAWCRGDGSLYHLAYEPRRKRPWSCTCPVRGDNCSHLAAMRLVVATHVANRSPDPLAGLKGAS